MQHQNKFFKEYKKLHLLYEEGAVFTAFDTETTALSPSSGRVIEIGAVKFNNDGIIDTFNTLINPESLIPPFITGLTHITQDMVKNSPVMKSILPEFLVFITDTVLIAHNAQFDLNFINAECTWADLPPARNKVIDTLQYSKWAFPEAEKHKLDFLADYLKLKKGSSHRAFDDADTCRQLFIECTKIRKTK